MPSVAQLHSTAAMAIYVCMASIYALAEHLTLLRRSSDGRLQAYALHLVKSLCPQARMSLSGTEQTIRSAHMAESGPNAVHQKSMPLYLSSFAVTGRNGNAHDRGAGRFRRHVLIRSVAVMSLVVEDVVLTKKFDGVVSSVKGAPVLGRDSDSSSQYKHDESPRKAQVLHTLMSFSSTRQMQTCDTWR